MAQRVHNIALGCLPEDRYRRLASKTLAKFGFVDLALVLAQIITKEGAVKVGFLIRGHRIVDPATGSAGKEISIE
jgi:hypothetical protein